MRLDVYVNYHGRCEEAFRYSEQHLGGVITGLVYHRFGTSWLLLHEPETM
jgi:PhnB protein